MNAYLPPWSFLGGIQLAWSRYMKKKIPECWILTISRCGCEGEDGECVTDYGKTTNNVCWIMSWTSQLACLVLNLIFDLLAWVSLSHAKYI